MDDPLSIGACVDASTSIDKEMKILKKKIGALYDKGLRVDTGESGFVFATIEMLDKLKKQLSQALKGEIKPDDVLKMFQRHYHSITEEHDKVISAGKVSARSWSKSPYTRKLYKSKSYIISIYQALMRLDKPVTEAIAELKAGSSRSCQGPVGKCKGKKKKKNIQSMKKSKDNVSTQTGPDKDNTDDKSISAKLLKDTSKYKMHKAAIADAIEQINEEEKGGVLERASETTSCLSDDMLDTVAITEFLDTDSACFHVKILVEKVWKSAILYFLGSSFEIMVQEQARVPLFFGLQTARKIRTHNEPSHRSQFILESHCTSYTCKTEDHYSQDEIVVTVKAFIKGNDTSKIKGLKAIHRLPCMATYKQIFHNLGTDKAGIQRESVAAAKNLIIQRDKDLKPDQKIKTEIDFSAERVDESIILNYLEKNAAVFHGIEINVNNVWETATFYFRGNNFQASVDGAVLIPECLLTELWVDIDNESKSPQFILSLSGASFTCKMSYTCRTLDFIVRDTIVVFAKAQLIKLLFHKPFRVWIKPKDGWFRLRTGVERSSSNRYLWGLGGLIQDEFGRWLIGFWAKTFRDPDIHDTQLYSLLTGLRLALEEATEEDLLQMEIEMDSRCLVEVLLKKVPIPPEAAWHDLAAECIDLLAMFADFEITVGNLANIGAQDVLAGRGLDLSDDPNMVISYDAPDWLHGFCSRTTTEHPINEGNEENTEDVVEVVEVVEGSTLDSI